MCYVYARIGTVSQINHVLKYNAVPPLVRIITSDVMEVKKEAAWALSNITSGI